MNKKRVTAANTLTKLLENNVIIKLSENNDMRSCRYLFWFHRCYVSSQHERPTKTVLNGSSLFHIRISWNSWNTCQRSPRQAKRKGIDISQSRYTNLKIIQHVGNLRNLMMIDYDQFLSNLVNKLTQKWWIEDWWCWVLCLVEIEEFIKVCNLMIKQWKIGILLTAKVQFFSLELLDTATRTQNPYFIRYF